MSKKWSIALLLGVTMAVSIFLSACGSTTDTASSTPTATTAPTATPVPATPTPDFNTPKCDTGSLTVSGSTALQPLVDAVAKDYQTKCSGATITVNGGGSKQGLTDVEAGNVQIGNSDVYANPSTQADLVDHQVAVVVFGLILNSKVTGVKDLKTAQIQDIYSGKTTNWKDVGGPDLPIVVVTRPSTSGTRATFEKYVLGTPETVTGPSNLQTDSTGTVVQNVKQTDGAIGYVALGPAKSSGLTILTIDGNDPQTPSLVQNNTYKFWNFEHMYTKGAATGLALDLINYMKSTVAKTNGATLSFIAIADMSADAVTSHTPKS